MSLLGSMQDTTTPVATELRVVNEETMHHDAGLLTKRDEVVQKLLASKKLVDERARVFDPHRPKEVWMTIRKRIVSMSLEETYKDGQIIPFVDFWSTHFGDRVGEEVKLLCAEMGFPVKKLTVEHTPHTGNPQAPHHYYAHLDPWQRPLFPLNNVGASDSRVALNADIANERAQCERWALEVCEVFADAMKRQNSPTVTGLEIWLPKRRDMPTHFEQTFLSKLLKEAGFKVTNIRLAQRGYCLLVDVDECLPTAPPGVLKAVPVKEDAPFDAVVDGIAEDVAKKDAGCCTVV